MTALQHLNDIPLVRKIHHLLAMKGGEARIVGGAVRDTLLANLSHQLPTPNDMAPNDMTPNDMAVSGLDIDMAMTVLPEDATTILTAGGLRVLPTGIDHGTITVFDSADKHMKIELTTLRIDVVPDGRHAEVAFTTDWHGDAARRDFTINAIYLAADGEVFDPFGGYEDLIHGRVRFIGDAAARINEDYLRILRFFRFHARFATSSPDQDAIAAIKNNAAGLARISGERITAELDKILAHSDVDLSFLVFSGVGNYITENDVDIETYEKFMASFDGILSPSRAGKYAALIPPDDLGHVATRLKFSNRRRDAIHYIAKPILNLPSWRGDACLRHAWSYAPMREKPWAKYALAERYALAMIRAGNTPEPAEMLKLSSWMPPELPLQGRDLIAAGVAPGEQIGAILSAVEDHWLAHDFALDKDELLSIAVKLNRG